MELTQETKKKLGVKSMDKVQAFIHNSIENMKSTSKDNKDNSTRLVLEGMQLAESFMQLSGQEKKNLALYVANEIGKASGIDIADTVEDTVDLIVGISKGEYDLNLMMETTTGILSCVTRLVDCSANRK